MTHLTPKRSVATRALFVLAQCTWGALQTIVGLCVFLPNIARPHRLYRGAVVTEWRMLSSVSLGLFIFVSPQPTEDASRRLLVHEYGHAVQSLMLGPLYLFAVGIPSATWASLPPLRRMRQKRRVSYYSFYTERWADRLGEWVTKSTPPDL